VTWTRCGGKAENRPDPGEGLTSHVLASLIFLDERTKMVVGACICTWIHPRRHNGCEIRVQSSLECCFLDAAQDQTTSRRKATVTGSLSRWCQTPGDIQPHALES
jgi:hypothetical protein